MAIWGSRHPSIAVEETIGAPAFNTVLAFFASGETPFAATLAAQVFGADTCERVDKPRGEFFDTHWTGTGGCVAGSTYTV